MGRKVVPGEQTVLKNGDQIEQENYCRLPSPMHLSTSQSAMIASPAVSQPPVYWMLAVNAPYMNTIGQVNLNWVPSQDPQGKDLPISDINTLRYFFNLGVEYFRVSSSFQQAPQPMGPPMGPPLPPPPPPPMMTADMITPTLALQPQMEQGQCSQQSKTNYNKYLPKTHKQASCKTDQSTNTVNGEGESSMLQLEQDVDSYSVSQESGCLSDCSESLSPTKSEGRSEDGDAIDATSCMTVASGKQDDDRSFTNSVLSVEVFQEQSKSSKGKKKYYMYGSHKLVKPIKEIPPRFQTLLAEMSAAKNRCEGQLIYIQNSFDQDAAMHLNADANCFVPGNELSNCFPVDGCSNGAQVSFIPCIMPPPNTGPVNHSALPQMTYVNPPPPPLPVAMNKPPPTNPASCNCCASCHLPAVSTSTSAASAATSHHSSSPTNTTFSVSTISSSHTATPQNPASMTFVPPPPIPCSSGLQSAPANMTTFPPNLPSLPPAPPSVPPPLLPPSLPPPSLPPPSITSNNNACSQTPAVQVSSHPLPGGGNYYIYHTSSSSTGFTASHSMPAQTPVYYVVSQSYPAAPCGYQTGVVPPGYGLNMHCQAAAQ